MSKRPLIIDCDPGVDDAQCIMMLHACGAFDIRGITAVHGNVSLESTGRNSLFLRELYGMDCPVALGAKDAIIKRRPRAEYAHGRGGLAGYEYTLENEQYSELHAWELIWQEAKACEGALELIAVGPLTNIAIAVRLHPELPKLVKQLTVMGGAGTAGNAGPYAEFNIWQDPHAAEIVLNAGFPNLVMVDLDTCRTGYFDAAAQDRLMNLPESNRIAPFLRRVVEFRRDSVKDWRVGADKQREFAEHMIACDAVAAAVCIDPSMAEFEDRYIVCECRSDLTGGQTVIDWLGFRGTPNVHLARRVDLQKYLGLFFRCVDAFDGEVC